MPDRDKIANGLLEVKDNINCPSGGKKVRLMDIVDKAIALLKEQETADTGSCRIFQCKKCGFGIDDIFVNDEEKYQIVPRYCPNCGRLVK